MPEKAHHTFGPPCTLYVPLFIPFTLCWHFLFGAKSCTGLWTCWALSQSSTIIASYFFVKTKNSKNYANTLHILSHLLLIENCIKAMLPAKVGQHWTMLLPLFPLHHWGLQGLPGSGPILNGFNVLLSRLPRDASSIYFILSNSAFLCSGLLLIYLILFLSLFYHFRTFGCPVSTNGHTLSISNLDGFQFCYEGGYS